jgi:tRNA(His) 5'-end guanylyltransferase
MFLGWQNLNICCKWSFFFCYCCSFVFQENTELYQRDERYFVSFMNSYSTCFSTGQAFDVMCNFFCRLILSSCSSCFTSFYMMKWKEYFPSKELVQPPHFKAEVLYCPKPKMVCDYLSSRQAECESFLLKYFWLIEIFMNLLIVVQYVIREFICSSAAVWMH